MINIKNIRMPVGAEVETTAGEIHDSWIVGFNQHRGLHILIEDGSVLTFFRDEVKKITPIKAPFPYKENPAVMTIRTEQSQQWAESLPELALGENEIQFNFGRTRKQVESAQKEIGKPTRSKPRQKTAQSHWLGMQ